MSGADWARGPRAELARRLDIRTSHEQRAAILALLEFGIDRRRVATAFGISATRISQIVRQPRPTRTRALTAFAQHESATCRCGAPVTRQTATQHALRGTQPESCQACIAERVGEKCAELEAWAHAIGYVPTATEAAEWLGVSRGRAGDYLMDVFGPDPRTGYQRRGRRPLPTRPKATT